ncbi:MAG: hypothetical protein ACRDND_04940, partial [Streptosporangiaceae bacterium]
VHTAPITEERACTTVTAVPGAGEAPVGPRAARSHGTRGVTANAAGRADLSRSVSRRDSAPAQQR